MQLKHYHKHPRPPILGIVLRLFAFAILSAGAALVSTGCSAESNAQQNADETAQSPGRPVKTQTLIPQSFEDYLKVTGIVEARNHINILVEEGGTLVKVEKDKGRYARQGEVLARLENQILAATYEQAQANLQQAELDHKSKKVLFEKRAISENEYLNAKYNLQAARAAYNLTKARFDKLTIRAPLNGIVNDRYYDLGAYCNPMTPILEFIDNDYMKIRAGVAERFLRYIAVGTPVIVSFDAYPDLTINAKVTFVSRSIDPQNRTFKIEIGVPNRDRKLAPQMIANIKIRREAFENRLVVPLDALVESENGWYVFIAEGDKARRVAVQKEAIYENQVLVEGLQPRQELIVVGQRDLSDGEKITVVRN